MASQLIRHLQDCIRNDSSLGVLAHQWGFDEQLIPKALQTVGTLFTHYSRHDESHSKQILVNIERLLGSERIKLLTATDTWLLLEAAYWHDVGMIVTKQEYDLACESSEFRTYLRDIQQNNNHPLNHLCKNFNFESGTWELKTALPYDLVSSFRELFAEWFRGHHADRAYEIVQTPWERCGLSSPRTELIPNRLFEILGKICQMHGCAFETLVSENHGLPYKEVGIGTEDCHPRYIAALLRIGDLLDLDDNRFCPVMTRLAGKDRPYLSNIHEKKHKSISHFRLDPNVIEVTSLCDSSSHEENIDIYIESMNWFGWLQDEIKNQMSNWSIIAPNKELGLLPTLGPISVKFKNSDYFIPQKSTRPQFGISIRKATDILQDLYTDQFVCIREIIQNAVDSTLIRIFLENENEISSIEEFNLDKLNHFTRGHNIKVRLTQIDSSFDIEYWKLEVEDQGTGISINDFVHMMKIGGSSSNTKRRDIISLMPDIMKPSGTFGIGFQSIFLLTDKVEFKTKSYISDEATSVTMYNPLGDKSGLCTFKIINERLSYGAKLSAVLKVDKNSIKLTGLDNQNENRLSNQHMMNYDPLIDGENSILSANLCDKVSNFSKYSLVNLKAEFKNIVDESYQGIYTYQDSAYEDWLYVIHRGICVRYTLQQQIDSAQKKLYFKGQQVNPPTSQSQSGLSHLHFFDIKIDILSGDANDWLTAERNKIRDKKSNIIDELLFAIIKNNINNKSLDATSKILMSLVSNYHLYISNDGRWKYIVDKFPNEWQAIDFNKGRGFNNIHQENLTVFCQKFMLFIDNQVMQVQASPDSNNENYDLRVFIGNGSTLQQIWIKTLVFHKNIKGHSSYNISYNKQYNSYVFKFKAASEQAEADENYIASVFLREANGSNNLRPIIPACSMFNDFNDLNINYDDFVKHSKTAIAFHSKKVFISPFILRRKSYTGNQVTMKYTLDRLDELCDYLIERGLVSGELTHAELKQRYLSFADHIKEIISRSDLNDEWKKKQ